MKFIVFGIIVLNFIIYMFFFAAGEEVFVFKLILFFIVVIMYCFATVRLLKSLVDAILNSRLVKRIPSKWRGLVLGSVFIIPSALMGRFLFPMIPKGYYFIGSVVVVSLLFMGGYSFIKSKEG